ncbi:MAG: phasin family protein [Candidatus Contendobacter sp.]|nr:phasin family protein [Candidatus Contendobacter sp.]MDG4559210.1 phasin family protein [Candidatus Contendobacter sp.]
MSDDRLSHLSQQYRKFLSPAIKTTQISMAVTEAFVYFYLYVLESNTNLLTPQLKEAAAVSDPQSWRAFLTHQAETLANLYLKSMEDGKMLSSLATHLKSKFDSLAQENLRFLGNRNVWRHGDPPNPVFAAGTLYNAMLEACMDLHLRALEAHTGMLASRLGEAAVSPRSWLAFLLRQDEATAMAYQKFLADIETLSDRTMRLQTELNKLIEESSRPVGRSGLPASLAS